MKCYADANFEKQPLVSTNLRKTWAVVVAQLEEWLLPTPEICSFEPCHWQKFLYQFIYQLYNRKDENKEKDAKNGPPFKNFLSGKSGR